MPGLTVDELADYTDDELIAMTATPLELALAERLGRVLDVIEDDARR